MKIQQSVFTWRHSGHVEGVNGETAAMEEWNIILGIELCFYANSSFCFIMQIWFSVHQIQYQKEINNFVWEVAVPYKNLWM